ncbi:hypothetical protein [Laceyella putida]|uniref:Tyr recombinase domain-containing protein n=1 Tax=Laceyella putida TaxID=110101 RepID=A0ABW2RM73_9BACL
MVQSISPHKLRHFLLTWLKKQGIDDALISLILDMQAVNRLRCIRNWLLLKLRMNMSVSFPSSLYKHEMT